MQAVIDEVTNPDAPKTILFIDEIHTLVGAGSAEGGIDAANMLKPALSRGQLQVIGATTISEYRKYIEKDAALERRFQVVRVDQPDVDQTVGILEGIGESDREAIPNDDVHGHLPSSISNVKDTSLLAAAANYEEHHGIKFEAGALRLAASLSDRYINDRFLPDKAIDIIDEAGALVQLDGGTEVSAETVKAVVSEMSNVPVGDLSEDESQKVGVKNVDGQGYPVEGGANNLASYTNTSSRSS